MTAIKVELEHVPSLITESAHDVLAAHGFVVCHQDSGSLVPLGPSRLAELLRELGRNAAQCLTSIDQFADLGDIEQLRASAPDVWKGHP